MQTFTFSEGKQLKSNGSSTMWRTFNRLFQLFLFFSIGLMNSVEAQNISSSDGVNFVGSINSYSQPTNGASDYRVLTYRRMTVTSGTPVDGRGQWRTTVNVQTSGGNVTPLNMAGGASSGFLFTSGGGAGNTGNYGNKWAFSGVGQASLNGVNATVYSNSGGGTDMGLNMSTTGYYTFVLADVGYAAASYYVGYTLNSPVTLSHTTSSQQSFGNGTANLAVTTSTTPSPGENVFVRYTTASDFSTGNTSTVVQCSGSGTNWSANLSGLSAGTTYRYYFFTSTASTTVINTNEFNKGICALNYADNSGSNYTFTQPATPATYTWNGAATGGDYQVPGNWNPARNTPATNDILSFAVGSTMTITNVPTQTIGQILITSGTSTLTLVGSSSNTLTLSNPTALSYSTAATVNVGANLTLTLASNTSFTLSTGTLGISSTSTGGRMNINGNLTLNGATLTVDVANTGGVTVNGSITFTTGTLTNTTASRFTFNSGSAYYFNNSATNVAIPVATWNSGSKVSIIGTGLPSTSGLASNTFADMEINTTATGIINWNLLGSTITMSGTLNVIGTNSQIFRFAGGTGGTINCGNYLQTGGTIQLQSSSGTTNLNCSGNFTQTGGSFEFVNGTNAGTANLDVKGNLTLGINGTWLSSSSSAGSTQSISFSGTSGQQTVIISGTNTAPTNGRTNLSITNPNGINLTGSLRVLSTSSNTGTCTVAGSLAGSGTITYSNGTGTATTLTYSTNTITASAIEFPSSSGPTNLILSGSPTVSFPASFSRTISGTLTLAGNLSIGSGNKLTLSNTTISSQLSYTSGFITSGTLSKFYPITSAPNTPGSNTRFPFGTGTFDRSVNIFFSATTVTGGTAGQIDVTYNNTSGTSSVGNVSDNGVTLTTRTNLNYVLNANGFSFGASGVTASVTALGTQIGSVSSLTPLRLTDASTGFGTLTATSGSTTAPLVTKTGLTLAQITSKTVYFGSDNTNTLAVTYTANTGSVNWNDPTAWSTNDGTVPGSSNDVIIPQGSTVTVNATAVCNNLTTASGTGTATLNVNQGFNLTLSGNLTTLHSSAINVSGNSTLTVNGSSGFSVQSNTLTIGSNGTVSVPNGPVAISATSAINQTGGSFSAAGSSGNLSIGSSSSTATFSGGTASFGGNLTVTSTSTSALTVSGGSVSFPSASATLSFSSGTNTISSGSLTFGPTGGGKVAYSMSTGTLTISGGTLNLNGSFSQSGGTLNISSGNFNIDGNDGTLVGSVGGTTNLFLATSGSQNVIGGNITIVDPIFGNVSNTGDALRYSYSAATNANWSGSTLYLGDGSSSHTGSSTNGFTIDCWAGTTGRLTLGNVVVQGGTGTGRFLYAPSPIGASGEFNVGGSFTINSNSSFRDLSTAGSVNLAGDVTINGTMTIQRVLMLRATSGSGGTFAASANAQTISGNGTIESVLGNANGKINNLGVNNSNTTGITFSRAFDVAGTLCMVAGRINLGSNNFTVSGSLGNLTSPALTAGAFSTTNMFLPNSSGRLVLNVATGTPTVTYPVGSSTGGYVYTPAVLTFTSNSTARQVGVNVSPSASANLTSGGTPTNYLNRVWKFSDSQSGTGTYGYSAAYTFSTSSPNDVTGTATSIKASYWNGTVWNMINGSTTSGTTMSTGALTQATGPIDATEWTGRLDPPVIYTWSGGTSDDWSVASNWDINSVPNSVTHNVIINNPSATFQPKIYSGSYTIGSLTLNGASGTSLSLLSGSTLNIDGTITYAATSSVNLNCASTVNFTSNSASQSIPAWSFGNLGLSNSGAKTFPTSGSVSICGTYSLSGATPTVTSSTLVFNGTGAQTIPAATYNNLTISGSRGGNAITLASGTITIGGAFSISASSYTVTNTGNTVDFSSASSQTIPAFYYSTITNTGNGPRVLDNSGNDIFVFTAFTLGSGAYTTSGSKVNYNGTSGLTLPSTTIAYNNLEISGNRGGNTVSFGSGSISISGTLTYSATNSTQSGGSGTLTFNGTGAQTIPALNYNNLVVSGARTSGSNVTLASGTITVGGSTLTLPTNIFSGGGTYVTTNNTLALSNGTGYALPAISYNNLTISGSGSYTLPSGTTTISGDYNQTAGTFTVSGAGQGNTLNIGGNFSLNGGTPVFNVMNSTTATSTNVSVSGTCSLNVTTASNTGGIKLEVANSTSGVAIFSVAGDFVVPSTSIGLRLVDFGGTSVTCDNNEFRIGGNFSKAASSGTFYTTSANIAKGFVFNGSGTQTFSYAGTNSDYVQYVVNSGSTLQMNSSLTLSTQTAPISTFTVSGVLDLGSNTIGIPSSAVFTLNSGGVIRTAHTSGLSSGITGVTGNGTGTRTFSSGCGIVYNGTGNQSTGLSGLTITTPASFQNSNTGGTVTLDANLTMGNTATFTVDSAANMQMSTFLLTMGSTGTITINGKILTNNTNGYSGSTSTTIVSTNSPSISYRSTAVVEYSASGPQTVTSAATYPGLNFSGSGNKTLSGTVSCSGSSTISSGVTLVIGANTFNVGGATLTNSGIIDGSNSSAILRFGGSIAQTYTGTGTFTATLNELRISNSNAAGVTLNSSITGFATMSVRFFNIGGLTNSSKLTIGNGSSSSTVVQISQASNNLVSGTFDQRPNFNLGTGNFTVSSLQESASRTLNFEYPLSGAIYKILINNSNGVSLASPLTLTDSLSLYSGQFNPNGNLTMGNGSAINRVNGSLSNPVSVNSSNTYNVVYNNTSNITSGSNSTYELNPTGAGSVGNITVQGTASVGTSSNTTAAISGNVTITGGTLSLGNDLSLRGNWSRTSGTFTPNTSKVTFNATGANQTVSATGGATFYALEVNNTNTNGTVTMNSALAVTNALNLTAGTLTYNSNALTLSNNATVTRSGGALSGNPTVSTNNNINVTYTNASTIAAGSTPELTPTGGGGVNTLTVSGAGTVNTPSASALSLNGNVSITNGTLALNHDLNLKGNWSRTGGTFTPGTRTVTFNASNANQTVSATGGASFYNLTVNNTNTNGTITQGSDLTVTNALTLTNGTLTTSTNTLTFGSSAGVSRTSGAINGTSGTVQFNNQPTLPTGLFTAIGGLTVNGGTLTLPENYTLGGTLTLSNGGLNLNGKNLTLNGGFSGSSSNALSATGVETLTIGGSGSLGSLFFDQTTAGTTNKLATLTVNRSGQTIALGNALQLTTTLAPTAGTLNANSNLTLLSTATRDALVDFSGSGSVTGNVTSQRYLSGTADRWRGFSAPVAATYSDISSTVNIGTQGQNGSNLITLRDMPAWNSQLQTWWTTSNWRIAADTNINATTNGTIPAGRGFLTWVGASGIATAAPATIDLTGTLNQSDVTPSFLVNSTNFYGGWMLIGNPFAANYDLASAYSNGDLGNVNNTVYIFSPTNNGFISYNLNTGVSSPNTPGIQLLAPYQPFLIQASGNSTASITLKKSRTTTSSGAGFNQRTGSNDPVIRLTSRRAGAFEGELLVSLKADATDTMDVKYDGPMASSFNGTQFYTQLQSGRKLTINALPEDPNGMSIPVYLESSTAGNLELQPSLESVDPSMNVWLEDKVTNLWYNLRNGNVTIAHQASNRKDRFVLHLNARTTATTQLNLDLIKVWVSSNQLNVDLPQAVSGSIRTEVLDMAGRVVYSHSTQADSRLVYSLPELAAGAYSVRVQGTGFSKTERIVLTR